MKLPENETAPAVVTFDCDTRVTSLSPGIEAIAGHSRNEVIGESVAQMLADVTVFQLPQILDTVKSEGIWEGEINFRHCNKAPVQTHGTVLPLSEGNNGNSEYLLLIRPGETYDEGGTVVSSICSEIGHRVRKLVHETNNSLAIIMGSTQLLSMNSSHTEKTQSDIEKIYTELGRVALVVETLHEYAHSLCERASVYSIEEKAIPYDA